MKQTPDMEAVQREMRPGVIARDGFLGTDTRRLQDILIADDAEVQRLGVTHAELAARLLTLRDAGVKGLGEDIPVPPHFVVRVESVRGKLPCPFRHPGVYQKVNTRIRRVDTGEELLVTDLGLHLIVVHGFYGGRGSPYRLDPEVLVRVLAAV